MAFTAEEIDYLDTKAEGEALRAKQGPAPDEGNAVPQAKPAASAKPAKGAKGRKAAAPAAQAALDEQGDPVTF